MLGKEFQPRVKSAADVLVGVAQVRIGLPSIRGAVSKTGILQRVTRSTLKTVDKTDGTTCQVVVPTDVAYSAGATGMPTVTGTYNGNIDGAFIIRKSATGYDVFGPDGAKDAAVNFATAYQLKVGGASSGLSIAGSITGDAEGDTLILPVWAAAARSADHIQTGIVSPYSLFKGSNESVGGLTSASFDPSIDDIKELTSGFPESVDDSIVAKTSVTVKFESQEFDNANIKYLREMMNRIMNEAETPAIPVEVVMRTRGNKLVTYWIPNASLKNLPSFAPQNDYSTLAWELVGSTQSEEGDNQVYNAWLANTKLYYELKYTH